MPPAGAGQPSGRCSRSPPRLAPELAGLQTRTRCDKCSERPCNCNRPAMIAILLDQLRCWLGPFRFAIGRSDLSEHRRVGRLRTWGHCGRAHPRTRGFPRRAWGAFFIFVPFQTFSAQLSPLRSVRGRALSDFSAFQPGGRAAEIHVRFQNGIRLPSME